MNDLAPDFDVENDLFSFETDHLALKGNEDYGEVLKTLLIMSAHRDRALRDYKKVAQLKTEALEDPFGTLEKIKNGEDLGVPPLLEFPKLPKIDLKKYNVKVPENDLMEIYSEGVQHTEVKQERKIDNSNGGSWTPEEQKRLEELLQIYPPEPIEMKRFAKIAKALGTRTPHQVASRLQKYFLKLYKAGLPIPGRVPKSAEKYRKQPFHKHQRHNHYLYKPTNFFPQLSIPVQMDDLNKIPGPSELCTKTSKEETDNYLIPNNYYNHGSPLPEPTPEDIPELKLKLLKRVKEIKIKEQEDNFVPFNHTGFKCDYCDESPIKGHRWFCVVCPDSVDFCTDCVISQLYSENPHPLNHWLTAQQDDVEHQSLLQGFSEPSQEFDKQINEELKSRNFNIDSEDDDEF
ncbi:unnamed protein product [Ceutorhynchus assimilis]|uniref:ZZ-type zinc finger-containing protein 3 n=1 Tax=Ceutorhynchus assimilis TaxID=467358 RepID=A0A9N9MY22_9CUCU|nr:unnamed protein product [Ceutorhynchus assimilis]